MTDDVDGKLLRCKEKEINGFSQTKRSVGIEFYLNEKFFALAFYHEHAPV